MSFDHHPEVPYGSAFVANGYLVTAPARPWSAAGYQGVDGDRWPIESSLDEYDALLDSLGVPDPLEGVRVATQWDQSLAYWRRCSPARPDARLLLVSTRYAAPTVDPPEGCWRRLGYDVAEPMGNHSVVWHELIAGTAPQLAHWRSSLNRAGLFEGLEEVREFLRERLGLAERGQRGGMELGGGFRFVPVLVQLYTGR